ncbi:MAG: AEC family transporter [Bacillota bacterium]
MEHFIFAFNALAPLLFLALIGYGLRRFKILDEAFIGQLNSFIFVIALPVLIFTGMSELTQFSEINFNVVMFAFVMILVVMVLGVILIKIVKLEPTARPVILQTIFRGNFVIIGVPLALRLGGDEAFIIIVVMNAFLVPLTNMGSIINFQLFDPNINLTWENVRRMLKKSFLNPIMIGIYFGALVVIFNAQWQWITGHISVVPDTLDFVSDAAIPMALIAIGGQFSFHRVKSLAKPIIVGVIGRLVMVPLVALTAAVLLRHVIDFDNAWAALIGIFATPVAVASVAVTKGLDGDDELASQMVMWTTSFAIVSIFVAVVVFRSMGLL